ncbi:MAG: DUF262 domain-containing HNH endonuclease family protein [Treponema sp.]|jgi:uncharacterized protein with ParB-like and HNH nuclease domain|nr:DUF262 domain-containing HNH endonuclease family protein [Treponema sp.]
MDAPKTIREMLRGNRIFVPSYQRAYSWDTEFTKEKSPKQINVFFSDINEYITSSTKSPYYFGHFLFENKSNKRYGVIDGQQRLTTIVIFLSVLFSKLKTIRLLTENEQEIFEDMIKRNSTYRFETVDYDNQLFFDYVIDQNKINKDGLETESSKRIVDAFDFFKMQIDNKDEIYLTNVLNAVQNASCTIHLVENESEAIQMFIFQNNRGKKPSNLEIIKAEFMFNVHLYGGEETESLLEQIKNRFEKIYKYISKIEYHIDEDDVLTYTLRVYFNSLYESNAITKIHTKLSKGNSIHFIKKFTRSLASSFEHLNTFFGRDERENFEIHSLVMLGGIAIAIPFVIKAYTLGLSILEKKKLCSALGSLLLRHRLIGTRADLISRINDEYQKFGYSEKDLNSIISRIAWMKTQNNWWGYWNNMEFANSISGYIHHETAKYLLWKYENYLKKSGKPGYQFIRYDSIYSPHLEHIAPQTPTNGEPIAAGYCEYDEEFEDEYIDCLGNYLLLSAPHNESIGNRPFSLKRSTYTQLLQQIEIKEMTKDDETWNKEKINIRYDKIKQFVLDTY